MDDLYRTDFYAWTQKQAELLDSKAWHLLDVVNLIEEIESLGKQQRQELRNRLKVLIGHLLKWQYQPHLQSNSWVATIRDQRQEIADLIQKNPSLKPYLGEAFEEAYPKARNFAVQETNLPYETFPLDCPYTLEQVLDEAFWT